MKELHLIMTLDDDTDTTDLTDFLGEHMRGLEALEANQEPHAKIGLMLDPSDPGRYAWRFETRALDIDAETELIEGIERELHGGA